MRMVSRRWGDLKHALVPAVWDCRCVSEVEGFDVTCGTVCGDITPAVEGSSVDKADTAQWNDTLHFHLRREALVLNLEYKQKHG